MSKLEFYLSKPLLNAPGFLGFSPNARALEVMEKFNNWGGFGAFVTDPISWRPRSPAANAFYRELDGQVLIHNGWPNRGFRSVTKAVRQKWERAPLPIIPSLLETDPRQAMTMIRELEGVENLAAVNLMPSIGSMVEVNEWLSALPRFNAELPIVFTLPAGLIPFYGKSFTDAGAAAIFPSAPRGSIDRDGGFVSARMYGSANFPAAYALARECSLAGIPLIAFGGINTAEKVAQLVKVHLICAAIDLPLWQ